jgi:hypothetical protein
MHSLKLNKSGEFYMPLYLAELYCKDGFERGCELIGRALASGFPPGVTLKAGPWASNEEAKLILIMEIEDHSLTFAPFANALAQGIFAKRRLTPIVSWSAVQHGGVGQLVEK